MNSGVFSRKTDLILSPAASFLLALPKNNPKTKAATLIEHSGMTLSIDSAAYALLNPNFAEGDFVGLPWGMAARRVVLYVSTYGKPAFHKKPNFLTLGKTKDEVMTTLGYNQKRSGGEGYKKVVEQLRRLICCRYFYPIRHDERTGGSSRTLDAQFLKSMASHAYINSQSRNAQIFFALREEESGLLELFINTSCSADMGLPICFERAKKLHGKCFKWDIFVFLADLLPRIPHNEPLSIPWKNVHKCFSGSGGNERNFRYMFAGALPEILAVYPEAEGNVIINQGEDLTLHRSAPTSPEKERKRYTGKERRRRPRIK